MSDHGRDPFARRRQFLLGAAAAFGLPLQAAAAAGAPLIEVWKSPSCGCCGDWVRHLESNGFRTRVHDIGNEAKRASVGIAAAFASCHTGVADGYALEGHVPARKISRLLRERPKAIGLTVPGMPIGSPGMDGPAYGGRPDRYPVILLSSDGPGSVYQTYP